MHLRWLAAISLMGNGVATSGSTLRAPHRGVAYLR